ncbi:MAG: hypothetical protein AAB451_03355 [Patescibacteria group bacterium]
MKKLLNIFWITLFSSALFFNFAPNAEAIAGPKPISPCEDKGTSLTPTLEWENKNAPTYFWEVYLRDSTSPIADDTAQQKTSVTLPQKLPAENDLKWRVQSKNGSTISDWSDWCYFNTKTSSSGGTPVVPGEPGILFLEPSQGSGGTIVDIQGQNFDCGKIRTSANIVIFTGDNGQILKNESPTCKSLGTLTTTIPNFPKEVKIINISVKVGDKNPSNSKPFTIMQPTIPPPSSSGQSAGSGGIGALSDKCKIQYPENKIKNPSTYKAGDKVVAYDGLVPCGRCVLVGVKVDGKGKIVELDKDGYTTALTGGKIDYVSCQFCHFFVMFGGIVNFLLLKIAIPAAILLLVIGGAMFTFSAGNPGTIKKGMDIMKSVAIGLVIMFTAWIVVSTVLTLVGVASWTGLRNGWFGINCPINI